MFRNFVSASYAKRKKKIAVYKTVVVAIILALLIFCLFKLINLPSLQISQVQVTGERLSDNKIIVSSIEQSLANSYLHILPRRFVLTYPRKKISENLLRDFPLLMSVDIDVEKSEAGGYTLNASLKERSANIIWCEMITELTDNNDESDDINKEKCFYSDDNGYIFAEAPSFSENVFLKLTGPININSTTTENIVGSILPVADKLADFRKFSDALLKADYIVKQIDYEAEGIYNIKFVVNMSTSTPNSYESTIFLDNRTDMAKASENFLISANEYDLSRTKKILQYVDLRFGNNIVFKWKDLVDPI